LIVKTEDGSHIPDILAALATDGAHFYVLFYFNF
jgi:hypothetical protein